MALREGCEAVLRVLFWEGQPDWSVCEFMGDRHKRGLTVYDEAGIEGERRAWAAAGGVCAPLAEMLTFRSVRANGAKTIPDRGASEARVSPTGRILVVDDDEQIREVVSMTLEDEGYEVVAAPDGAAALEQIGRGRPDAILLDMRMPVMDGWQFTRAYRRLPGPHAPIIVMTAAQSAARWAAEIDADGYVAKPFDLDRLHEVVGRYAR